MQVILTEEEYLKLKHQSSEDHKTYIKRIDVALALEELEKELRPFVSFNQLQYDSLPQGWKEAFQNFIKKI